MDVVRATVAYGRQLKKSTGKQLYFTITTNGTLLNEEQITYINQNLDNVVLNIDGRKAVHDAIRCYPGGQGSYERILPNARRWNRTNWFGPDDG
jgi:uncharacterized protein